MKAKWMVVMAVACLMTACEKPYVGVDPEQPIDENVNVIVRIAGFETIDFDNNVVTKAPVNITELCSRINVVVYDGETKLKSVAQKQGDAGFGTVGFDLPQGTYTLAVIAHNSDGTATVTTLDKISFKNNRVTDTFSYCSELEVTGEQQVVDVELKRVVAMFRMVLTQPLQDNIRQLKFYYTGGSSTLSALTGYGSVNSKQTVVLDVESGQTQFDVYTIPHAETGKLKMTITALDATETPQHERVFEEVPVQRNKVTRYTGNFYEDAPGETGGVGVQMRAAPEWDGEEEYSF